MLRLFALLLLIPMSSGCSALCPDSGGGQGACERQVEDNREDARRGWKNAEKARDEMSAPQNAHFASHLKRGMTADELRETAGTPNRRQQVDARETWSYDVDGSRALNVMLVDGKVVDWRYVVR